MPTVDETGALTGKRILMEFFVCDVAPNREMRKRSVEIEFPAVIIRKASKPERDQMLADKLKTALATFAE